MESWYLFSGRKTIISSLCEAAMQSKLFRLFILLSLFGVLVSPGPAFAQDPQPPGPQQAPDGLWYTSAGVPLAPDGSTIDGPLASGGPDLFGYTWTDTA